MTAYKPKTRRPAPQPQCQHAARKSEPEPQTPELPTHAAPSHLGAQISVSGSWLPRARGGFGFVQTG